MGPTDQRAPERWHDSQPALRRRSGRRQRMLPVSLSVHSRVDRYRRPRRRGRNRGADRGAGNSSLGDLPPEPQRRAAHRPALAGPGRDDPTDRATIGRIGRRRRRRSPRLGRHTSGQRRSGRRRWWRRRRPPHLVRRRLYPRSDGPDQRGGCHGRKRLQLVGAGGSGSGGQVWIQSFISATFAASLADQRRWPVSAVPIGRPHRLLGQASGGGGPGLVQVEAAAPTPLNFNLQPAPSPTSGAVYSNPPFIYAGGLVTGEGRSGLRYTGVPAPDYTGAVEVFSLGNAASAKSRSTIMARSKPEQHAAESDLRPGDDQVDGDRRRTNHRREPRRARRVSLHRVHRGLRIRGAAVDAGLGDAAVGRLDHDQLRVAYALPMSSFGSRGFPRVEPGPTGRWPRPPPTCATRRLGTPAGLKPAPRPAGAGGAPVLAHAQAQAGGGRFAATRAARPSDGPRSLSWRSGPPLLRRVRARARGGPHRGASRDRGPRRRGVAGAARRSRATSSSDTRPRSGSDRRSASRS